MKAEYFKYYWDLVEWVNNNIPLDQIISITTASTTGGYVLFYKILEVLEK